MGSLLAKRISFHFSCHSPVHLHRVALPTPLLQHQQLSTQPSPSSQPQKEMPFIAQYLISSFGFSPNRALKLSSDKSITSIKSPDRPDAVIKFLRDTGLSDSQIQAAISHFPKLLRSNVDKTLKPIARGFVENGFSERLLVQLIRYCPGALTKKIALSRLLFWRDFVGEDGESLLKIIQMNNALITSDIGKHNIVPKINTLKEYGLSNQDIVYLLGSGSRCMWLGLDSLKQTIELIKDLGLAKESGMFRCGLKAVGSLSIDKIHKKAEFYKATYGWSNEDV